LTNNPAGGLRSYGNSYSPDGQWIVLRMETGDQSGDFQSALFKMKTDGKPLPVEVPTQTVKHIRTDVAPGLATNPEAIPKCSFAAFNKEALPGTGLAASPRFHPGLS